MSGKIHLNHIEQGLRAGQEVLDASERWRQQHRKPLVEVPQGHYLHYRISGKHPLIFRFFHGHRYQEMVVPGQDVRGKGPQTILGTTLLLPTQPPMTREQNAVRLIMDIPERGKLRPPRGEPYVALGLQAVKDEVRIIGPDQAAQLLAADDVFDASRYISKY